MTDARLTQAPVLKVYSVDPDARLTQAAVMAVYGRSPPALLTQAAVMAVYGVVAPLRLTQTPVLVVYGGAPCITQRCRLWTLTLTDGARYFFTSLDRDVEYGGDVYRACDSFAPSASEGSNEVGTVGNTELIGIVSSADGLTAADLYAGRLDGARVEEWLHPWGEGPDSRYMILRGTFGKVEFGDSGFSVDVMGDGGKLQQTSLMDVYSPRCRWDLGDTRCGYDLESDLVTGTVESATGQRSFVDEARTEPAGYFNFGKVTFLTGANAGISAEIKGHGEGGVFTLWPRLANAIAEGDTYELRRGCDGLKATCKDVFLNLVNWGGFEIPGEDAIRQTPNR